MGLLFKKRLGFIKHSLEEHKKTAAAFDPFGLPDAAVQRYSSDVFTSAQGNDLDIAYAHECNPWTASSGKMVCVCTHKAEAHIVVAVPRPVVVTVSRAQVLRIVVPATAA